MLKIPKPAKTPKIPALINIPMPVKQIITVIYNVKDVLFFDIEVNGYLLKNWKLKRRDIIAPHGEDAEPLLYAELERETAEPILYERQTNDG